MRIDVGVKGRDVILESHLLRMLLKRQYLVFRTAEEHFIDYSLFISLLTIDTE